MGDNNEDEDEEDDEDAVNVDGEYNDIHKGMDGSMTSLSLDSSVESEEESDAGENRMYVV